MRGTIVCTLVLTLGCVAGRDRDALVTEPWADHDWNCESFMISMGDDPVLEIENGRGRFRVTQKSGRVAVILDGDRLPEERVLREGDLLRVTDEAGMTVLMLGAFGRSRGDARQLVYSPDLDPATVNRRFGFGVEPLEKKTGWQTGLDPLEVVVVSKVCPGSPAEEGGLLENDIIVHAEDAAPVTAQLLARKAAGMEDGSSLLLQVFRGGRETEIGLAVRDRATWPDPPQVEEYLRRTLDD